MSTFTENPAEGLTGFRNNRWVQLVAAVLGMFMIAATEYGWSSYAVPLTHQMGKSLPQIQYGFTMLLMTWGLGQAVFGYIVDKVGPRWTTIVSGIIIGGGWMINGRDTSLGGLYFIMALCGLAGGLMYGVLLGTGTKWFPDKRGLANGIADAGFGLGSLALLPVLDSSLKVSVTAAFTNVGLIMLIVLVICGSILKWPKSPEQLAAKVKIPDKVAQVRDLTPGQILRTGQFWLLWITFLGMQLGGLMLTANNVPFAKHNHYAAAVIATALVVQNFTNGGSRVFWGWISDHFGRYRTMGLAFFLNAVAFALFPMLGSTPGGYIVAVGLAFLTWGEVYSLMPSANADAFGTKYSTTSYGFLYTTKAVAAIFGGGLGATVAANMGWGGAFGIAAVGSLFSAVMAAFVIPRFAKRHKLDGVAVDGVPVH